MDILLLPEKIRFWAYRYEKTNAPSTRILLRKLIFTLQDHVRDIEKEVKNNVILPSFPRMWEMPRHRGSYKTPICWCASSLHSRVFSLLDYPGDDRRTFYRNIYYVVKSIQSLNKVLSS